MRAIMVCVDYSDLLAVTLPYNRHHFQGVCVVTTLDDHKTTEVAVNNGASVYHTNAFTRGGAVFNKWAALEEGLDSIGRRGWLCVMDADVLWPKVLPPFRRDVGCLYTPLRRMAPWPLAVESCGLPPEGNWGKYPLHRNVAEWAGYSQVFHAEDPRLGPPPWHETDWVHAGGADSMFQLKWPKERKVRPPFEVLHLGPAGTNWCGRASAYADGTEPERARDKLTMLKTYVRGRAGKSGGERFRHEKLR